LVGLGWQSVGVLELAALPSIDDQTAITAIDGAVRVVSEGHWKHLPA
jgi:hypothetical protein